MHHIQHGTPGLRQAQVCKRSITLTSLTLRVKNTTDLSPTSQASLWLLWSGLKSSCSVYSSPLTRSRTSNRMRERKGWRHSLWDPGKVILVSTPASSSNEGTNLQATYTKYMELLILQPKVSNKEGVQWPGECSSPSCVACSKLTTIRLVDWEVHPRFHSQEALILSAKLAACHPCGKYRCSDSVGWQGACQSGFLAMRFVYRRLKRRASSALKG